MSGAILAALEHAGRTGAGRAELESAAGASAATVRRRLSELADAGLILREGTGRAVRYRLADAQGSAPSVAPGGSPAAPPVPPPADRPADPAPELPGTPAQPVVSPPRRGTAIVLPPLSSVPLSGGPDAGAWWRRLTPPSWLRPVWLDRFRTSSEPGRLSPSAILAAAAGSTAFIGAANGLVLLAFQYWQAGVAVTIALFLIAGGAGVLARRGKVFRWVAVYTQTLLIISIAAGWWMAHQMATAHASLYSSGTVPVLGPGMFVGVTVYLGLFLLSGLALWYVLSPQQSEDRHVLAVASAVVVLGAVGSVGLVYWEHGHVSRRTQAGWVYSPSEQAQQLIVFEYYRGAEDRSSVELRYKKIVCPEAWETVGATFAPLFELSANMALEIEDGDTAPETIDGDRAVVTMRVIVIEDQRWDDGPHEVYHRGTWTFGFRAHGQGWCMDRIDTPPGYPPGVAPDPSPGHTPSPSDGPEDPPAYSPPGAPDYTPPTLPGEGETPTLPGETD
ncbi:MAG: hypothetical protein ACRD2Z_09370 [Thermoanaerobaculia bacterium]